MRPSLEWDYQSGHFFLEVFLLYGYKKYTHTIDTDSLYVNTFSLPIFLQDDIMEKQTVEPNWGARKRLYHLEFKLYWEGRVNRSDLTAAFDISIPQASADFARYQELAPKNIVYNPSGKYYVPDEEFIPRLIQPSADAYFSYVTSSQLIEEHTLLKDDYIGFVPKPTRIVDESILRTIIQAVKYKRKINVDYRSLKNPHAGNNRWISPHAFAADGFRWHIRAYCHSDNIFKDYVLGRIVNIFDRAESDVDVKSDSKWFNFIDVVIGPNPKLNDDQKNLISMDYGMTDQKIAINCRVSLLGYLLKRLGLNNKKSDRSGEEQHIALINAEDIYAVMNQ